LLEVSSGWITPCKSNVGSEVGDIGTVATWAVPSRVTDDCCAIVAFEDCNFNKLGELFLPVDGGDWKAEIIPREDCITEQTITDTTQLKLILRVVLGNTVEGDVMVGAVAMVSDVGMC
jgi:hypothetical protein